MNTSIQQSLALKRKDLIADFIEHKNTALMLNLARIFDEYFQESFGESRIGMELSISKSPFAIVALGGYGRKEQCIYSDVDILFLFEKHVPRKAEALVQEIIYPLWDMGTDVGHCTRSISECLKLAKDDFEVLTSLLDSRFICGMSNIYTAFRDRFEMKILHSNGPKLMKKLKHGMRERQNHYGDSSFLLEPNVKEGKGGLRDYHAILWGARISSALKHPKDLVYEGMFSHQEFERLMAAVSFIFNARNCLHWTAERKCDQLFFEYQADIAGRMGFKEKQFQKAVESFLGRLHGEMECIQKFTENYFREADYAGKSRPYKMYGKPKPISKINISKNMLWFEATEDIVRAPLILIEIFKESARLGLAISAESGRIIKEFSHLIKKEMLRDPEVVRLFEYILETPVTAYNVMDEMLSTGILRRLIPEFGKIENKIQFDAFHVLPVDKHSLKTLKILKQFGRLNTDKSNKFYHKIYKEISHQSKWLLWAALLHDIGKGIGDDHAEAGAASARKILKRFGYAAKEIDTVALLVEQHLLLNKVAARRDIKDEETAIYCAGRIHRVDILKMLYLLTVADAMATGPKAWNEWHSMLLRELFFNVMGILERGELSEKSALESIEKKKIDIKKHLRKRKNSRTMVDPTEWMSPRYLLYTDIEEIINHVRLYENLEHSAFVWDVVHEQQTDTRQITLCGKDEPGLFSKIAGVLTLNDLDILDAKIYTWKNRIALDIFKVSPPPDKIFEEDTWSRAEQNLKNALQGELDLEKALKKKISAYKDEKPPTAHRPHCVKINNKASSFFTIIEIFTYDYKGLLFRLTDVIYRNRLDIWVAKIATKSDQVVDVFYVRDLNGEKIDAPEDAERIEKEILQVLEERRV